MLKPLAKCILIPLELTAAVSATDAAIQKKKYYDSAQQRTLFSSNEDLNDIVKIIKSLKDASLLIKDISETVENEIKELKEGFLGTLVATLGGSSLSTVWTGKDVIRAGAGATSAGEESNRPCQDF